MHQLCYSTWQWCLMCLFGVLDMILRYHNIVTLQPFNSIFCLIMRGLVGWYALLVPIRVNILSCCLIYCKKGKLGSFGTSSQRPPSEVVPNGFFLPVSSVKLSWSSFQLPLKGWATKYGFDQLQLHQRSCFTSHFRRSRNYAKRSLNHILWISVKHWHWVCDILMSA